MQTDRITKNEEFKIVAFNIGFGMKPLKRNFQKACKMMSLKPEQVMVIGNDLFDDIFGGKRNKMVTGLVKEVEK